MKLLVFTWPLLLLMWASLVCQQTANCSSELTSVGQQQQQQQRPPSKNQTKHNQQQQREECEYEKGAWEECQANGNSGEQIRTLRLKSKQEEQSAGNTNRSARKCQPIKLMRRECKVGCKYARGEWSNSCGADGLRVRIDTLIPASTNLAANSKLQSANSSCQPKRRVTKDCKRACHYIKSAWSECVNGWKTRNLTLDNSMLNTSSPSRGAKTQDSKRSIEATELTTEKLPVASGCAPQKQVRRECGAKQNSTARGVRQQQQQQQSTIQGTQAINRTGGKAQTPAQRRRQKQLLRQQEKENRLKSSSIGASSSSSSTTTSSTTATTSTTTTPTTSNHQDIKKDII